MLKRVLTGLGLLGGFVACVLFLPVGGFAGVAGIFTLLGAWEWAGLTSFAGRARYVFAVAFALVYALLALGFAMQRLDPAIAAALYVLAAGFWVTIAPTWLARGVQLQSRALAIITGALVIIPAALAMAALRERSAPLLLALLGLVWIADSAAYFAGRRFGRHQLAPVISPGKTWEGAAGGLVASIAYAIILAIVAPHVLPAPDGAAWAMYALAGAALFVLSVVGDLFESAVKRGAGVKNSGTLLPGHGGVLDRIDSATSTLPVAALAMFVISRWA